MEMHRARRAHFSAKSIAAVAAVLLSAALLSGPHLASAADDNPSNGVGYGTSTAVVRGTRPPAPKPAAPARTAAPRTQPERDLGFRRTFPYGFGWNNDLNWEGINSEPQIDTIQR
jgi:hypothetical protein